MALPALSTPTPTLMHSPPSAVPAPGPGSLTPLQSQHAGAWWTGHRPAIVAHARRSHAGTQPGDASNTRSGSGSSKSRTAGARPPAVPLTAEQLLAAGPFQLVSNALPRSMADQLLSSLLADCSSWGTGTWWFNGLEQQAHHTTCRYELQAPAAACGGDQHVTSGGISGGAGGSGGACKRHGGGSARSTVGPTAQAELSLRITDEPVLDEALPAQKLADAAGRGSKRTHEGSGGYASNGGSSSCEGTSNGGAGGVPWPAHQGAYDGWWTDGVVDGQDSGSVVVPMAPEHLGSSAPLPPAPTLECPGVLPVPTPGSGPGPSRVLAYDGAGPLGGTFAASAQLQEAAVCVGRLLEQRRQRLLHVTAAAGAAAAGGAAAEVCGGAVKRHGGAQALSEDALGAVPGAAQDVDAAPVLGPRAAALCPREVFHPSYVLANLYRDGQDYVGAHADRLTMLGPLPVIASLSLGATRTFRVRRAPAAAFRTAASNRSSSGDAQQAFSGGGMRESDSCGNPSGGAGGDMAGPPGYDVIDIELRHNSLLIMWPPAQEEWLHEITRAKAVPVHSLSGAARINLTFRQAKAEWAQRAPSCRCGHPAIMRCYKPRSRAAAAAGAGPAAIATAAAPPAAGWLGGVTDGMIALSASRPAPSGAGYLYYYCCDNTRGPGCKFWRWINVR